MHKLTEQTNQLSIPTASADISQRHYSIRWPMRFQLQEIQ